MTEEQVHLLRMIVYAPMQLIPTSWPYRDKIAHAIIGTLLFSFFILFTTMYISLSLVVVAAFSKEMLDKFVIHGTPDVYDFLATITIPTLYVLFKIIS